METIKVEYKGITIEYWEDSSDWNSEHGTHKTLKGAKAAIDKALQEDEAPYERHEAIFMGDPYSVRHSHMPFAKYSIVTVTSKAARRNYLSTAPFWVTGKDKDTGTTVRKMVEGEYLVRRTPEVDATILKIQALEADLAKVRSDLGDARGELEDMHRTWFEGRK